MGNKHFAADPFVARLRGVFICMTLDRNRVDMIANVGSDFFSGPGAEPPC